MNNYLVSFEEFKTLSYNILNLIELKGKIYKAVLCPLRGGFFLSYFIARHLNIPIRYIEISSYTGKQQKDFNIGEVPVLEDGPYLLCDDIYDSGNTIKTILEIYRNLDLDVAVVLSKKNVDGIIFGKIVDSDKWVDFFWEVM